MDTKNNGKESLRFTLILVFFLVGHLLVFAGWKMTGELAGLGLMIVGVILLLTSLFVYNAAYNDKKRKKR